MKITILCSAPNHPITPYLQKWMVRWEKQHDIHLVHSKKDLTKGDILFLISCSEIITQMDRAPYAASLVVHASDLPHGRGWSPHIWQIVEGCETLVCALLEAEDKVDSGRIWKKIQFSVPKTALWNEINQQLFEAETALMDFAVLNYETVVPTVQSETEDPVYYPRRTPNDSMLDPRKTIVEQFDLLRVCDPDRFPAYFEHLGCRYIIKLEKAHDADNQ